MRYLLVFILLVGCAEAETPVDTNREPLANAGPDQTVELGQTVYLSGEGSWDREMDPLTFRWSLIGPEGSQARLNATASMDVNFVPDLAGVYEATLTVHDGKIESEPDFVLINVELDPTSSNRPPVADAGNAQNVQVGQIVQLDGTRSSDPDADPLSFAWSIVTRPPGSTAELNSPSIPRPSFVADRAGTYTVELRVRDGIAKSTQATVEIRAFLDNTPPIANAGADQEVATGSRVQLSGIASYDADSDPLVYVWEMVSKPAGSAAALSETDIVNPTFNADVDGTYELSLKVQDGQSESNPDTVIITASTENIRPVADAGQNRQVALGQEVVLDSSASFDANDNTLTYVWSWVSKPAASQAELFDKTTASARFVPDVEGDFSVQLVVSDGSLESSPSTVTISATQSNRAPVAAAGSDQSVLAGSVVQLDGTQSTDPDQDTLIYRWSIGSKPQGSAAALSNTSAAMPTFTADLEGSYVIQLIVNDGSVDSAPDSLVVSAQAPGMPQPATEGDVVITEFMNDPDALSDTVGEWFEIHNPTNSTWSLSNCVIEDLGIDTHTISEDLVIGPGEYKTLARSTSPGFTPDYVYANFLLANSDDEIIITCNGNEIAQVAFDESNGWSNTAGATKALKRSQIDEVLNDSASAWCEGSTVYVTAGGKSDLGTPGAQNEAFDTCP